MGFAIFCASETRKKWLYPSYELRPLIRNRPERSCGELPAFFGAHGLLIDIEPQTGALRRRIEDQGQFHRSPVSLHQSL